MKKIWLTIFSISLVALIGINWSVLAKKGASSVTKETLVTPYLENKISPQKNLLYCGTFQLAWNELQNKFIKEKICLNGAQEMVSLLNQQSFTKENLSSKDYVAMVDYLTPEFLNQLNQTLKSKFGNEAAIVNEKPMKNAILAYAFLYKNLNFAIPFETLSEKLNFSSGNQKTQVKAFGIKEYTDKLQPMAKQVKVLNYENSNDFIISLATKSNQEELILAKINPKATLAETIALVEARSQAGTKQVALEANETLQIPKLDFLIDHNYQELEGKTFLNKGWESWQISKAKQWIKFQLNEQGATLKSEAKIIMYGCAAPNQKAKPRSFIFDQPFLIYLKEAGKKPYFALWINNTDLLVK